MNQTKQSFTTFTNDIIQGETIFKNANQKLTYMYLYSFANCSKIFPSISSIATAVCCTTRTAMKLIQELEDLGLIRVQRTQGKSNVYILCDYHEVASEKISPVKNVPETSEKISPEPVKNIHSKNTNLKSITKNKISSRECIDNELKALYPDTFEQVKEEILKDSTLIINTDKQYRSMLLYRLKNSKGMVKEKPKQRRAARSEVLPTWFEEYQREQQRYEVEQQPVKPIDIEELRREISKYSH